MADWQINDGGSNFGTSEALCGEQPETFTFTYNGGNSYSSHVSWVLRE